MASAAPSGPAQLGLEPGCAYEMRRDLLATANVFAEKHGIRLEMSSSTFPRFDRNTDTEDNIAEEAKGDLMQAVNRITTAASVHRTYSCQRSRHLVSEYRCRPAAGSARQPTGS